MNNIDRLDDVYPKTFEVPFNSDTKIHITIHRKSHSTGGMTLHIKGAPEIVWKLCSTIWIDGKLVPIDENYATKYQNACDDLALRGCRILACGILQLPGTKYPDNFKFDSTKDNYPKSGYTFLGLLGLQDPPKPNVFDAVKRIRGAGIKMMMITGDNPVTAEAIAKEVGIIKSSRVNYVKSAEHLPINGSGESILISGQVIDLLTENDWDNALGYQEIVFARTFPSHKLEIVRRCQQLGHIVAVTGDGVNDSAALKKADMGIAMNRTGSDISKESARMILLDDNFASTVYGILEGRLIFQNLKKAIKYSLSHIIPEVMPYLLFVVVPMPLAITPTQMLMIDLGFELILTLSYAFEPAEDEELIMSMPPRRTISNHDNGKNDLLQSPSIENDNHRDITESVQNLNIDAPQKEHINLLGGRLQARYGTYFKTLTGYTKKSYWVSQYQEFRAIATVNNGERLVDGEVMLWSYLEAGIVEFLGAFVTYLAIFWFEFGVTAGDARLGQIRGNLHWKPKSPSLQLENGQSLVTKSLFRVESSSLKL